MAKLMRMVILATALSMMVVAISPHAEAAISCDEVVKALLPCESYLKDGGDVPKSCCSGISSLNSAASTTAERQAACQCVKAAAEAYKANAKYAAGLPKACDVSIGYPISYSVNCSEVH